MGFLVLAPLFHGDPSFLVLGLPLEKVVCFLEHYFFGRWFINILHLPPHPLFWPPPHSPLVLIVHVDQCLLCIWNFCTLLNLNLNRICFILCINFAFTWTCDLKIIVGQSFHMNTTHTQGLTSKMLVGLIAIGLGLGILLPSNIRLLSTIITS